MARPWRLSPSVALRPEPFGALAYHVQTRRLSFLKSRQLLMVVSSLADHPDAWAACQAAAVSEVDIPQFRQTLAMLAETQMIVAEEAS